MFDKNKDGDETKVMSDEQKEELTKEAQGRHDIARRFENATKDTLYREWGIFESRYGAVLNLKKDASKVEVKRAIARVKRASMDVRDALKDMGQFKV
jgi:hypothetical protein